MRLTSRMRAIRNILTLSTLFGIGGGCIAIYSFDREPPLACKDVKECPGSDVCGQRACEKGACKLSNIVEAGALTINNKPGNCQRFVCDGRGNEIIELDGTNVRVDGDNCTDDVCTDGKPFNQVSAAGTPCGANASVTCSEEGLCHNCVNPSDCGEDTACITWSCESAICIKNLALVGEVAENPVPGDCKKNLCNSVGEAPETIAPDDAPSDQNPCTSDYCTLEGVVVHEPSSAGTNCGLCSACTTNGTCSPCDPITSDCYADKCIPKPKPCGNASECPSNYCVDGFCCDTECNSPCRACSNDKTGIPSGLCGPALNGTDPHDRCVNPPADTCLNGECSCENGEQDGNEAGTDCGGVCGGCTGTWNCGGACDGNVVPKCCWENIELCVSCADDRQTCKNLEGNTCALGAASQRITLGKVIYNSCIWPKDACRVTTCKCQ